MNDVALASITMPLSVNCNDCASINAFLLSLLGIKTDILYLSDAYPFKNGFMCNEIISIGNNTWEIPFKNGACPGIFRYHAVCSSLDSELSYKITDSCLKVDGGINPWSPDIPNESIKVPELPFDMPFKDPLTDIEHNIPAPPYMGQFYRERLCTNPESILACKAVKVTGNIGFDMTLTSSLFIGVNSDDIFINPLIKEKFLKYSESNRGKERLIPNYSLNETSKKREYISIDKLSYADTIYFNNNEKPCVKVSYFNLNSYQEAILLINNFINTSVCFYKINNKLSEYTDVAFSEGTESESLLFFAIENIVIFVEKIDNSDTDIYSIAQQIINQIK